MMKWIFPWLYISIASAEVSKYDECNFVLPWARQAMHIARKVELPADRWIITEDGFEPEEYATIMAIKNEAYHDVPALAKRVTLACGKKEES
jgi:hypothetical protein